MSEAVTDVVASLMVPDTGFERSVSRERSASKDSSIDSRSSSKNSVTKKPEPQELQTTLGPLTRMFTRKLTIGDDGCSSLPADTPTPRAVSMFPDPQAMKDKIRQEMCAPVYDVADFYWDTGLWQHIARAGWFEKITLCVIAFNALWIGIDTDLNDAEVLLQADPLFQIVEHSFCVYFSFEWYVRFKSFRRKRDGLKDGWFVFDSILVAMMFAETWIMTAVLLAAGGGSNAGMGNASILRMARLLRLSRMARMARLFRAFPELLILIKGIAAATRSVFFTLVLLGILTYVFGIAFRQLLADDSTFSEQYGSVFTSMHTLLLDGALLDACGDRIKELGEASFVFPVIFYVYILFAALTVMNMLIGVLCEVVSGVAEQEKEKMNCAFVRDMIEKAMSAGGLDKDGDGHISKGEFAQILENRKACRALEEVGVDIYSLVDNIDTIFAKEEESDDSDDDGYKEKVPKEKDLSFEDFMSLILSLRGTNTATVKDIVDLRKLMGAAETRIRDDMKRYATGGPRRSSRAAPWQGGARASSKVSIFPIAGKSSVSRSFSDVTVPSPRRSFKNCPENQQQRPHLLSPTTARNSSGGFGGGGGGLQAKQQQEQKEQRCGSSDPPPAGSTLSEQRRLTVEALIAAQVQVYRLMESMPPSYAWESIAELQRGRRAEEVSEAEPELTPSVGESAPSGETLDVDRIVEFCQHMGGLQDSLGGALSRLGEAKAWPLDEAAAVAEAKAPGGGGGGGERRRSSGKPCKWAADPTTLTPQKRWQPTPALSLAGAAGAVADSPAPPDTSLEQAWATVNRSSISVETSPVVYEAVIQYISTSTFPEKGDLAQIYRLAQRQGVEELADEAARRMRQELSPNTVLDWARTLSSEAEEGDQKAEALLQEIYSELTTDSRLLRAAVECAIRNGRLRH